MATETVEIPVCIYHDNCNDGMGAAWTVWKYFKGEVDLIPMNYGNPPPALFKRNIFIVDFSFPKATLESLGKDNNVVIVLDHHKTAAEDLKSYAPPPTIGHYELIHEGSYTVGRDRFPEPVFALFDLERSGAGITWDYFFPGEDRPELINFIEDRDLWKFSDNDTRAVHSALSSYEVTDFRKFDEMVTQASNPALLLELIDEGQAIDRRTLQMIKETIKAGERKMKIGGHTVPVCNAPFSFASDMGNLLCIGHPFSATYFDLGNGKRQFSLRSTNKGLDVSAIAKFYGGGGHRNAAGFTAAPGWEGDQ